MESLTNHTQPPSAPVPLRLPAQSTHTPQVRKFSDCADESERKTQARNLFEIYIKQGSDFQAIPHATRLRTVSAVFFLALPRYLHLLSSSISTPNHTLQMMAWLSGARCRKSLSLLQVNLPSTIVAQLTNALGTIDDEAPATMLVRIALCGYFAP